MLSNLASYLMGSSAPATAPAAAAASAAVSPSTPATALPVACSEVAQGTVLAHQELRCTEDEDWLLVDPDAQQETSPLTSTTSSTTQDVPSGSQSGTAPISIRRRKNRRNNGRPSQGKSKKLEETPMEEESKPEDKEEEERGGSENCAPSGGLEESWRPVKLATSPLENLLIEHPSMSVYHHSVTQETLGGLCPEKRVIEEEDEEEKGDDSQEEVARSEVGQDEQMDTVQDEEDEDEDDGDEELIDDVIVNNGFARRQDLTTNTNTTPSVPHLKSQKVALEAAMLGGRVSQKKDRSNKATQLDRLNKCRNAASNGQKLRRSDRQHSSKNSFANNNRKSSCQRMSC